MKLSQEELLALLEDTPEERARYEQMEDMRELAGAKGASFDHVNAYTKHNYLAGILHALEATRTRLSIKTAEELIDYLYIWGYSFKRILFILYDCGFVDYNRAVVSKYISQNKSRLNREQRKLKNDMAEAKQEVFQSMRESVMEAEEDLLTTLLAKARTVNEHLKNLCPIKQYSQFNQYRKLADEIAKQLKDMHGIDLAREAAIEVGKAKAIARSKRELDAGFWDEILKSDVERIRDVTHAGSSPEEKPGANKVIKLDSGG